MYGRVDGRHLTGMVFLHESDDRRRLRRPRLRRFPLCPQLAACLSVCLSDYSVVDWPASWLAG